MFFFCAINNTQSYILVVFNELKETDHASQDIPLGRPLKHNNKRLYDFPVAGHHNKPYRAATSGECIRVVFNNEGGLEVRQPAYDVFRKLGLGTVLRDVGETTGLVIRPQNSHISSVFLGGAKVKRTDVGFVL